MNRQKKTDVVIKNLLKTRKECEKINEKAALVLLVSFGERNKGCGRKKV